MSLECYDMNALVGVRFDTFSGYECAVCSNPRGVYLNVGDSVLVKLPNGRDIVEGKCISRTVLVVNETKEMIARVYSQDETLPRICARICTEWFEDKPTETKQEEASQ